MKKLTLIALVNAVLLTACQSQTIMPKATQTQITQSKPAESAMQKTHTIKSQYTFSETVDKLSQTIEDKGMTIFATIDHKQAAQDAGLDMQPATVIVFGTPKAGTPFMLKDPTFALQLPLKVLVTEVGDEVLVSFHDTKAMVDGSQITFDDVKDSLAKAEMLIKKTVTE
ncbi:hypothetical protein MOMA_03595 [Moraxella macacae 0408225]|uniref:DUF302 domain-containing protein n=1 Tax=Moraxella macacae 0408225 TaxID=1230338 RepID=L2F965_9GAMM|nr:DUF302 domain-containing protein [Moraxella macacae]ELA09455.1 hypothetical protein MOMA_03595 [Moraxella macacae 0408225]